MDSAFRELLADFLSEAAERIDAVEQVMLAIAAEPAAARTASMVQVKRDLHTLKGNAGMMGFADIQALAHQLEDRVETFDEADEAALGDWIDAVLAAIDQVRTQLADLARGKVDDAPAPRAAGDAAATEVETLATLTAGDGRVRVPYAKIDELVELQAEALVLRNRLADAVARGRAGRGKSSADGDGGEDAWERVARTLETLGKSLDRMQDRIIDLGMVPLEGLFRSLGRIVHDESVGEGKRVALALRGGDTPIDKALLEVAAEALGHVVRNAVIHGIEAPEVRTRRGKPALGTVTLAAAVVSSEVRVRVTDDGGGIDLATLNASIEGGGTESPRLDALADDPLQIVFEAGVTSRGGADLSAGRGVGLSAVKASVERVGGQVEVSSEVGVGTTFTLRLPLTTTILRSLLLETDREIYALPLGSVVESLHLDPAKTHNVNHTGVLRWRGRLLPLLDLGLAFGTADAVRDAGFAVVIATGGRNRVLVVDDIVGIRDIVVKGLDPIVGQPVGISGSTILGDGRVIMILDPVTLVTLPPSVAPPS